MQFFPNYQITLTCHLARHSLRVLLSRNIKTLNLNLDWYLFCPPRFFLVEPESEHVRQSKKTDITEGKMESGLEDHVSVDYRLCPLAMRSFVELQRSRT
jgi:hypothetical protein